jgi:hypothetical protein
VRNTDTAQQDVVVKKIEELGVLSIELGRAKVALSMRPAGLAVTAAAVHAILLWASSILR